ncbi:recombinase family protein [Kitasatospora sp. NBC_01266]|uniref:recombinase family protein n=1 Tax=Kitasatospora sp. NBC_01266 TaxID=2903572 RepID=UPI002E32DA56|nr:recombinase family protein [Kitasatospora sp. NBC_01266]
MRAVSYIRQSKKREDDSQASPAAQRTKTEALIIAKGWENTGHFEDVGKSGWDPNVTRPGFEELMAAVRAGHVDAVVVFSLSRLTRQGALEAMKINDELARHGVRLVSVEEPYLDTSTPMGIAIFGLIAALAQQESDLKSAYITATKDTLRTAGSHVSGIAPYGFQTVREQRGELSVMRLIPDPVEAPHVRDMARWAADGKSAGDIARQLTRDDVPTKVTALGEKGTKRLDARRANSSSKSLGGPAWTTSTVLRILRDPRLAGFAMVWEGRRPRTKDEDGNVIPGAGGKRTILRGDDGAPVISHDGVIPAEEWWGLQEILNGRSKVVARSGRRVPTLLAGHGMLFCDVCGSVMVADKRNTSDGPQHYYKCNRLGGVVPGHGGLLIRADVTDDHVAGHVWARLTNMDPEDPEDLEWLAEASLRFAHQQQGADEEAERIAAAAELEHVREALRTLYQDRQDGLYTGETGKRMFTDSVTRLTAHEERVSARLEYLQAARHRTIEIPHEWTEPGENPIGEGSTWAAWPLERKREFLALFVDSVRITKAVGRGRNANTQDRVIIKWAELPSTD